MSKWLCGILVLLLFVSAGGCTDTKSSFESTPTDSTPAGTTTIDSSSASSVPDTSEAVPVTRIVDGDTIEVDIDGALYKVRYIGVDTPEIDDQRPEFAALAQEAVRFNRQMVEGQYVYLEKDVSETDQYGRLLRYVYVGDVFVNAELVRSGLAWAETYSPDIKYQDILEEAEAEARQAGIGIWAETEEPSPIVVENVQITAIFYDGTVPYTESDEYVEITNLGDEPQNLDGCVLVDIDEGYPSFTFPSYILEPGESVRVYTNETHPEWGGFSFESSTAVWNNSEPDTAALYDNQGNLLSMLSY